MRPPQCDALYPRNWAVVGISHRPDGANSQPDVGSVGAFAITEALHKRGMELHAWFNPYRALHPAAKSAVSANHIRTKPQLVAATENISGSTPANARSADIQLAVVMDVVKRYDVDGVHFDDYFYPYPEKDASGQGRFPPMTRVGKSRIKI